MMSCKKLDFDCACLFEHEKDRVLLTVLKISQHIVQNEMIRAFTKHDMFARYQRNTFFRICGLAIDHQTHGFSHWGGCADQPIYGSNILYFQAQYGPGSPLLYCI